MAFGRIKDLRCRPVIASWLMAAVAAANDGANCTPHDVDLQLGASPSAAAASLSRCGAVLLRGALAPEPLVDMLQAFKELPASDIQALRHGRVREQRLQTHLPFAPPFDGLDVFGIGSLLQEPLRAVLGDGFVLDLVTVVEVSPGSAAQDPHRDTASEGSVAVHIPLHDLSVAAAPLSLCVGTHVMDAEGAAAVMREAILYRPQGETSQQAKMRLYCGGRQPTERLEVRVLASELPNVRVTDSRLGASILGLPTAALEALPWRVGDEITHMDGSAVKTADDFQEFRSSAGTVAVRLERPISGPDALPHPPPRHLVAAPLVRGDVLLYDSRIFHWGMAHTEKESGARYVMYANFKRDLEHDGVHAEAMGTNMLREARQAFQVMVERLRVAARAVEL